jgi:hypothetical protein
MTDRIYGIILLLVFLLTSMALTYGMGYVFGAALTYFGWLDNPHTFAFYYFCAIGMLLGLRTYLVLSRKDSR